jgi:hypothetical protein
VILIDASANWTYIHFRGRRTQDGPKERFCADRHKTVSSQYDTVPPTALGVFAYRLLIKRIFLKQMYQVTKTQLIEDAGPGATPGIRPTLDVARLAMAIEAVETALHRRHENLPPSSKAILLARLYQVTGSLCPMAVDRLIDSLR